MSDDNHGLAPEDLSYPTLEFEAGEMGADGEFDLSAELDREEMAAWCDALAGALTSHDLGVEAANRFATFGVAPQGVGVAFDPDEDHRGDLEVTFRLSAKAMVVGDEGDEQVGARGDAGFVPLSTVTEDESPRCYNWVDDPEDPE